MRRGRGGYDRGQRRGGGGGGGRRREPAYKQYMKKSMVEAGLKRGQVYAGKLRINQHNPSESYVTVEGVGTDVLIDGKQARNRAYHQDGVVIALRPTSEWVLVRGAGEDARPMDGQASLPGSVEEFAKMVEGTDIRPTGEVVYITESHAPEVLVGTIKSIERAAESVVEDDSKMMFYPFDKRMPLCMVYADSVLMDGQPLDMRDFVANKSTYIYSARLRPEWTCEQRSPVVRELTTIGEPGDREVEVRALLVENGITWTEEYDEAIEASLPGAGWSIPDDERARRRDFRAKRIVSVDPITARDLDDALSVQRLDSGNYEIGVHIADVSHFVHYGDPVDVEAQRRTTSVYLVPAVFPMLPRVLSEHLCSLNPGVERCAFSLLLELTPEAEVVGEPWIGQTVIRSCCKLDYGTAQNLIDGKLDGVLEPRQAADGSPLPPLFTADQENAALGPVALEDVQADLRVLMDLGKKLRAARFASGAVQMDDKKFVFELGPDGNPTSMRSYTLLDTNRMIEDFMLLANRSVAGFLLKHFPHAAVLRRHPPPNERKMKELSDFCEMVHIDFDASTSAALQRTIEGVTEHFAESQDCLDVFMKKLQRPMNQAKYFCMADADQSVEFRRHFALAFDHYTHFTSPIRRYADVMVHRLLADALAKREPTMPTSAMTGICDDSNELRMQTDGAERRCDEVYMFLLISRRPELADNDAMVMEVFNSGVKVYIAALDLEARVVMNGLSYVTRCEYAPNGPRGPLLAVGFKGENDESADVTYEIFSRMRVRVSPNLKRRPIAVRVDLIPPVTVPPEKLVAGPEVPINELDQTPKTEHHQGRKSAAPTDRARVAKSEHRKEKHREEKKATGELRTGQASEKTSEQIHANRQHSQNQRRQQQHRQQQRDRKAKK